MDRYNPQESEYVSEEDIRDELMSELFRDQERYRLLWDSGNWADGKPPPYPGILNEPIEAQRERITAIIQSKRASGDYNHKADIDPDYKPPIPSAASPKESYADENPWVPLFPYFVAGWVTTALFFKSIGFLPHQGDDYETLLFDSLGFPEIWIPLGIVYHYYLNYIRENYF